MSVKISALPAAAGGNITDATVVPLVDATTTTTKMTLAQLRAQVVPFMPNNTYLGALTSASAPVALVQLTNDATNITRFRCGVDAGGFQWTPQAAGSVWLALTGTALTPSVSFVLPSTLTSVAGSGTDLVFGGTTQTTIGANGAASALTANPLGYIVFFKGATKCILPYFNG